MTTETTFEDRLLDRLRLVVAANSAPPQPGGRQARRRRWPVAAVGLAAAGVAAALVVVAGGTQAAYAVDSHPDGSVTVHIASLSDAPGLQAALRDRGIAAFVDYSASCRRVPAPPAGSVTSPDAGRQPFTEVPLSQVQQAPAPRTTGIQAGVRVEVSRGANGTHGVTFTIDPSSVPAGKNVYITTYSRKMNALSIRIGSSAPTPPCPPAAP